MGIKSRKVVKRTIYIWKRFSINLDSFYNNNNNNNNNNNSNMNNNSNNNSNNNNNDNNLHMYSIYNTNNLLFTIYT